MKSGFLRKASPWTLAVWFCLVLSLTATVHAQTPSGITDPVQIGKTDDLKSGDIAWMLVSAALVLMMTGPGLALFYGGLVRRKNVLATMMHCFILMALVSVLWAIIGYSLAFDVGHVWIGGTRFAFLREVGDAPSEYARTIPHSTWMVYQMMFAIITPALICGAYAERMKFSAMLLFSTLWLLCVYCPMAHMVWGKGGLFNAWMGGVIPTMDFAGGTVVHISSGISALVCAIMLGRRRGFGHTAMPPHSVVLSVIGAAMLWVGWFGFNAGSALAASGLASTAFVNTHLAASSGALTWAAIEWIKGGKPTVLGAISGAVAGLVAITPAAGYTIPMYGLLIGVAAGFVCFFSATTLKQFMGYDDALDAFGVHGTGGTLGAILTGVFAVCTVNCPPGLDDHGRLGLVEGNWHPVVNQCLAVGLTWVLAAIGSWVILTIVDATVGLRVPESDEYDGLDLSQHGESGYNLEDAMSTTFAEGSGH